MGGKPRTYARQVTRRAAAYHEAGHAVMFVLLSRAFRSVTIRPTPRHLGLVTTYRSDYTRRLRLRREGYVDVVDVIISVAGAIAERRATGKRDRRGSRTDYRQAIELVGGAGRDIDTPLVRGIIRAAVREAGRLLDEHWSKVDTVAAELLERETLTAPEVHRACLHAELASR